MTTDLSPATGAIPLPAGAAAQLSGRPAQRTLGATLVVSGAVSNQFGAAMGALAFPAIGPVGVVAIRQLVTALVLVPVVRPRMLRYRREQWLPVLALALVFSVMNLALYSSVQRVGLGLAVTLEFLGPLTVALLGSRRIADVVCALIAGAGVVVLAHPSPTTDLVGIGLGLIAAAAWAMYILLNRTLGRVLPGIEGTAAASAVASVLWLPVAVVWFVSHPLTPRVLLLAAACGVLASAVPYAVDLLALRRVPAPLFGVLTSLSPVCAALVGWWVLDQRLAPAEWGGIALIVAASAIASVHGIRGTGRVRTVPTPRRARTRAARASR